MDMTIVAIIVLISVVAALERVDMLVFRGEFWKKPVKP